MNLQEMFWANAAIQAIGFVAVIIIVIAMDTEIAELYELALNQARTIRAKQAEIDRLMLEYCPDEMTPEQKAEWAANQKPVDETPENRHDGCGFCTNPLYAGTKCKNCGRERDCGGAQHHRYAGHFGD